MAEDYSARLFRSFVNQDPSRAIDVIAAPRTAESPKTSSSTSSSRPRSRFSAARGPQGPIDEYTFTQAAVVAEQVTSFVLPPHAAEDTGVTVLVGTMHHDLHSIDKNIAAAALKEAGHRVIDLGVERAPGGLPRACRGDRRAASCSSSRAWPRPPESVSRVREMFSAGDRGDVVIFVGGGPFVADPALARSVGANGVSRGAESALKLVDRVAKLAGGER